MIVHRGLLALAALSAATALWGGEVSAPAHPAAAQAKYLLGPEDQIEVKVVDFEEIPDKPVRIDPDGNLQLPLIGTVRAAGLSVEELTVDLQQKLQRYVKRPRVTVNVTEYRSQPVSVLGAVNTPGVHRLQGPKSLVEVLSQAGGLRADAGSRLRITRQSAWGTLPLPGARADVSGKYSVAEVDLEGLMRAANPQENIAVRPQDVISVPRADIVYVIGEVRRSGGFTMAARERISILQALALAEGLQRTAAPKRARILRSGGADGAQRTEVAVNIQKILDGQAPDVPLQAEDILFIPNNLPRSVALRTAEAALQIGTGMVIWRR